MSNTNIAHKPLGNEIVSGGFQHILIERSGDIAIFHKVAIPNAIRQKPRDAGFEVVRITRHDGYVLGGVKIEPAEVYPSSSTWGSLGWTCPTLLDARLKFGELQNKPVPSLLQPKGEAEEEIVSDEAVATVHQTGKTRGRKKGERPVLKLPKGQFSTKDLAEFNKVDYQTAVIFMKENPTLFKFVGTERRASRGKPTNLFTKV